MVDSTDCRPWTARIPARDPGRFAAYSGVSHDHPLTLTVEQAGRVLGVGRSTAYELVRSGDLKCIRLRRRIVVPVAHLAESLGVERDAVWATLTVALAEPAGPPAAEQSGTRRPRRGSATMPEAPTLFEAGGAATVRQR